MAAWYLNHDVILLTVFLVVCTFHEILVEADQISEKEFGIKERTVYDVSDVIRSNENPNGTDILPKDLYDLELNSTTNYYFVAKAKANQFDVCWVENQAALDCANFGIVGISIMFHDTASKSQVVAMEDMSITNTSITNLLKMDNASSIYSVTILLTDELECRAITNVNKYLVERLEINKLNQHVKIGIEYSDKYLSGCAKEFAPFFESLKLDHTILRIHFSPLETRLLYSRFFEKVYGLVQSNRLFIQKFNPGTTLYVRLQNVDWRSSISWGNYERYNSLMATFLHRFSKENSGDEVFIFSPIPKHANILPTNVYFKQNVSLIYDPYTFAQLRNEQACVHQNVLKVMLANVENSVVDGLQVHSALSARCKMSAEPAQKLPSNSSFSLMLRNWDINLENQAVKNGTIHIHNPAGGKIAKVYVDTENLMRTSSLTKAAKALQSQNIEVSCFSRNLFRDVKNTSAMVDRTVHQCGPLLLNMSNEVVHSFKVQVGRFAGDLLKFLSFIDQVKVYFEKVYPGKTWTPALSLILTVGSLHTKRSPYCSPDGRKYSDSYEMVYNFANIHGWSRLMIHTEIDDVGIWNLVRNAQEIKNLHLSFPLLFRTNAAQTENEKLPMTYPCIQKTLEANQSHINFSLNEYSGATFQTNLRKNPSLSPSELNTTLQLALTRFASVELVAVSQEDFKLVQKVIVTNAQNVQNISAGFVYIEVPLADANSLQQEIESGLANGHVAVHVRNWESLSDEQLNLGFPHISTPSFGLTVQNCNHEMNSGLAALKNLSFMPQVSYVVCKVPPVALNNLKREWKEEYFGTLFYTKSYMEHFLSNQKVTGGAVEVMFRLNYICSEVNEMEYFLTFLNDVNQHSAAYKIRYFLVPAFEAESSIVNCSNSWWRLDSYADLGNISTYVNREDEYAGRKSRVPYEPPSDPVQTSNAVYYIVIVPIVAILIVAITALWLHHQREKTKILTKKDITQFYNGNPEENADKNYLDFGNMKFSKEYEIPRKDIETEEVIGSGQFGVVHRGILSKSTEVAIKIPRSDVGKEQFKSTLSELKILCHIGQHLNIVSFLGACTKDIAKGNLYIVIEYCKNGCLVNYLQEHRESSGEESISLFEMYGFSLGIACGMEYIADKRVVHADLAARNVLLTAERTCKVADFGLSRRLYEMNEYVKTSQEPLPWRWMAPESLRDMEFTTKSDVWSYGVMLWEIFSLGAVPYPGLNWTANFVTELVNGMRMDKALHATDNIHAKMLDCWNINSEARPTFTELKKYFVALRNEEYLQTDQF